MCVEADGREETGSTPQNDVSVEMGPIFGGTCDSNFDAGASCWRDALDLLDSSWDASSAAGKPPTPTATAVSNAPGEQRVVHRAVAERMMRPSLDRVKDDDTVPEYDKPSAAAAKTMPKKRGVTPLRVRFSPTTVVVSPRGETRQFVKREEAAGTRQGEKERSKAGPSAHTCTGSVATTPASVAIETPCALTDGQHFVPRRNGMHTAWRLHKRNNPPVSVDGHGPASAAEDGTIIAKEATPQNCVEQHREEQQQQKPGRLFLRRQARPVLSHRPVNAALGTTFSIAASKSVVATKIRGEAAPRRVFVAGDENAGTGRVSGSVGTKGGRQQAGYGREGGSTPVGRSPAGRGSRESWSSPVLSTTNGPRRKPVHGAPNLATAARSLARSSGLVAGGVTNTANGQVGDVDDARPVTAPARLLSSPSVRKNLARAARASKVGTKADPVTLYRQRQELERARSAGAAARTKSTRTDFGRRDDCRFAGLGGRRDWKGGGERAGSSEGPSWR